MKSFKQFLVEALIDVDATDVNMIYAPLAKPMRELSAVWKKHMKRYLAASAGSPSRHVESDRSIIARTIQNELTEVAKKYQPMFGHPMKTIDSSKLKSATAKAAHEINPIKINIYLIGPRYMSNSYNVQHKEINICLPDAVAEAMMGRLATVPEYQLPMLQNEVSEIKHKTTIRHELTHWLDDSLHNLYLTKSLLKAHEINQDNPKAAQAYYDKAIKHGEEDIYMSPVEITPMVNQVAELKRRVGEKKYDSLTWFDVVVMLPALEGLNRKYGAKWRKIMFTRLARENLIGKKFRDKLS